MMQNGAIFSIIYYIFLNQHKWKAVHLILYNLNNMELFFPITVMKIVFYFKYTNRDFGRNIHSFHENHLQIIYLHY